MPLQKYQARVAEHTLVKGDYQLVTLDLVSPQTLDFQAGQYIMLTIPDMLQKRSYSIASSPSKTNQLDILFDVSPQGDGSLYLQSLKPGEEVEFMAPAGQFTLSNDSSEQKLTMIATGSGISAIRSMSLYLLQTQNDPRPISLHWGMRFVEDIFWEDEFRLLEKQFPNFHFDLVLSKPPEGWPLCSGHIDQCISNHYTDFQNTGFYICGNLKMIESVKALLESKGVTAQNIHHERFF